MSYRNLGSETDIGHVQLRRLGQAVELDDILATEAIQGGACILPAADFDVLGFTDEELKMYATPGSQINAPAAFKEKLRAGWMAVDKMRRQEVTHG